MMVLISKTGEPFWNGATELEPEGDAFELVTSFGKAVALNICREEVEGAASPEERDHWTEVEVLVEALGDDHREQPLPVEPHNDDRQLALFN